MDLERRLSEALHEVADADPPADLVDRALSRLPRRRRWDAFAWPLGTPALAAAAVVAVVVVFALAIVFFQRPVPLPPIAGPSPSPTSPATTPPAPTSTSTPPACPAALIEGTLVEAPPGEIALMQVPIVEPADATPIVIAITWEPAYFSIIEEGGQPAVADPSGRVLARIGDYVEIGGGVSRDGVSGDGWYACGELEVAQLSFVPGPTPATFIDVEARPLVGPIEATVRSSAVWTGTEVIFWGGWYMPPDYQPGSMVTDAGAAYDPGSDRWRTLRSAPLAARQLHFAGWTGEEMLIWGGSGDQGFTADGAAYDPLADSWRRLPAPPPAWVADLREMEEQGGPDGPATVWTGQHWVIGFKGIGDDESDPIRLAAYEPTADAWEELPTVRGLRGGGLQLVWTGSELVLVSLEDAWRIRVGEESWRSVSRAPWDLPVSSPVSIGDRVLAIVSKWGPNATAWSFLATWDPASDAWLPLVQPPRSAHGQILLREDLAIVLGSGLAYDLSNDVWVELPLEVARNDAVFAWTGRDLVTWGAWDCDMCGTGVFQDGLVLTPER